MVCVLRVFRRSAPVTIGICPLRVFFELLASRFAATFIPSTSNTMNGFSGISEAKTPLKMDCSAPATQRPGGKEQGCERAKMTSKM